MREHREIHRYPDRPSEWDMDRMKDGDAMILFHREHCIATAGYLHEHNLRASTVCHTHDHGNSEPRLSSRLSAIEKRLDEKAADITRRLDGELKKILDTFMARIQQLREETDRKFDVIFGKCKK